jgi:hypothetical protein
MQIEQVVRSNNCDKNNPPKRKKEGQWADVVKEDTHTKKSNHVSDLSSMKNIDVPLLARKEEVDSDDEVRSRPSDGRVAFAGERGPGFRDAIS